MATCAPEVSELYPLWDIWLPSIAMEGLKGNDVHGFFGFFTRLYGLKAFKEGLAAPSLSIMQGMGVAALIFI